MPGFVIQRMATTTTTSSNIQIQIWIQIWNLDTYCLLWTYFSERCCFNISKMFLVFNIFLPISLIVRREDDGPDMFGGNIGRRCWLMTGGNMFCISSRYLPDTFPCLICFFLEQKYDRLFLTRFLLSTLLLSFLHQDQVVNNQSPDIPVLF